MGGGGPLGEQGAIEARPTGEPCRGWLAFPSEMVSVDIELALVGLVAMLEPATLVSSFLVLVLGRRPLRTGSLFYLGGLGATLAVGVLAAVVLGNAAAAPESSPKTWVSIFNVLAGVGILGYVAWSLSHPSDPQKTKENIARMRKLDGAPAASILLAGAVLANAGIFMLVALKDVSQLNPTRLQYILDWTLFALVSLLPLGVALLLLRLAPGATMPVLGRAGNWIEHRARTIALIIATALAVSLLREGIAGLSG